MSRIFAEATILLRCLPHTPETIFEDPEDIAESLVEEGLLEINRSDAQGVWFQTTEMGEDRLRDLIHDWSDHY